MNRAEHTTFPAQTIQNTVCCGKMVEYPLLMATHLLQDMAMCCYCWYWVALLAPPPNSALEAIESFSTFSSSSSCKCLCCGLYFSFRLFWFANSRLQTFGFVQRHLGPKCDWQRPGFDIPLLLTRIFQFLIYLFSFYFAAENFANVNIDCDPWQFCAHSFSNFCCHLCFLLLRVSFFSEHSGSS